MHKILLLLAGFVGVTSTLAQAQTIYPSGVSGCVARWTFDERKGMSPTEITDESGNNNHGTNNNITSVAGWKGLPNTAGSFNGTTSWSQVAHHATLNCPTEITMISLIKFNGFNDELCQNNQILSKGYPHFIAGNYGIGACDGPSSDCYTYMPAKTQLLSQVGNGTIDYPAGDFLDLNKWYFLATTISPTKVDNYVVFMDPNLKQTSIMPVNSIIRNSTIGNNLQSISIGRHLNPEYPYHVDGDMDEVVLFNRALSTTEIYSVYDFLYGSTTSIGRNLKDESNINVTARNGQCVIAAQSTKFSYEIYNSIGQLVAKKSNCFNLETVDLRSHSSQMLFVKILDEKNKIHNFKVNLFN